MGSEFGVALALHVLWPWSRAEGERHLGRRRAALIATYRLNRHLDVAAS